MFLSLSFYLSISVFLALSPISFLHSVFLSLLLHPLLLAQWLKSLDRLGSCHLSLKVATVSYCSVCLPLCFFSVHTQIAPAFKLEQILIYKQLRKWTLIFLWGVHFFSSVASQFGNFLIDRKCPLYLAQHMQVVGLNQHRPWKELPQVSLSPEQHWGGGKWEWDAAGWRQAVGHPPMAILQCTEACPGPGEPCWVVLVGQAAMTTGRKGVWLIARKKTQVNSAGWVTVGDPNQKERKENG